MSELLPRVHNGSARLHHVFAVNRYLVHPIDYLRSIRSGDVGSPQSRGAFVEKLDERFCVSGGRFQNCKFHLIDAVNRPRLPNAP